jgi:photosystem II stability/assembly factor-like uncharacterized protein
MSVCITSDGTGLIVGDIGEDSAILVSPDAGATWSDVSPDVPNRAVQTAVCGISELWIFGVGPVLLRSVDRGATWTDYSAPLAHHGAGSTAVSFTSNRNGWAMGSRTEEEGVPRSAPVLLQTTDGAATWHPVTLPVATGMNAILTGVVFASDGKYGMATGLTFDDKGQSSAIGFLTENGGKGWEPLTFPAEVRAVKDLVLLPP